MLFILELFYAWLIPESLIRLVLAASGPMGDIMAAADKWSVWNGLESLPFPSPEKVRRWWRWGTAFTHFALLFLQLVKLILGQLYAVVTVLIQYIKPILNSSLFSQMLCNAWVWVITARNVNGWHTGFYIYLLRVPPWFPIYHLRSCCL